MPVERGGLSMSFTKTDDQAWARLHEAAKGLE